MSKDLAGLAGIDALDARARSEQGAMSPWARMVAGSPAHQCA